ncbi:hypothetical protein [Algoriphagus confluentis]|uniref:Lipoprotein n=1 Tax=Algoriphagus confluentis TaxID=1697556 RepID=A0ABQ6PNU0_9BACT|nr:hypothetical protein Aconfl_15330 [Algoriphagus confluentis]
MLKLILVNSILLGFGVMQCKNSSEYDLINYLSCGVNNNILIDEELLIWKDWGFDSYSDLPTKNINSRGGFQTFDLDSSLTQKDKEKIEHILASKATLIIEFDKLSCKEKLYKAQGFIPKKTIYSYSFPILLKGKNQEFYGIVLEQKTFELNSEIKLKVFVRQSDSWECVYEELLGFS